MIDSDKKNEKISEAEKKFYKLLSLHNFNNPEFDFSRINIKKIDFNRFESQINILKKYKSNKMFCIKNVLLNQLLKEQKIDGAEHETCQDRMRFINYATNKEKHLFFL